MQKKLEDNIWKFTVILITNKRIFAAILGVYYLSIPDVTAQTIGSILLIGNLAGVLMEVPSGYISDKLGHKHALVLARVSTFLSSFFLLIAENTFHLILGAIFLSIGIAFLSGTGAAFMHETMKALGREKDYTKVMGKASSLGFSIPIVFTVLIPFLMEISYKAPFVLSLFVNLIGLLAALSLTTPKSSPDKIEEIGVTNFKQVINGGLKINFFRFAIFTSLLGGSLLAVDAFRAPYQSFLEIPVIWFGVLFGIGRGIASILLFYSGKIKEQFTDINSFFRFQIFLYVGLILLLVATTNPWVVGTAFILINGFQWGLSQVSRGFMLEIIGNSNFKATLISAESLISKLLEGVISFGIGFAITQSSYQTAFMLLGAGLLVVIIPQYLFLKKVTK